MREIKFRAWDKKHKKMHPYFWVYSHGNHDLCRLSDEFNDYIWLQHTGLKDKSGREIFEFDLIVNDSRNSKKPHKVEFLDGKFVGIYGRLCYDLYCELYEIEIIGNVYENPELLEE